MQALQRTTTIVLMLLILPAAYSYTLYNYTHYNLVVIRNSQDNNVLIVPAEGQINCPKNAKGCSGYVYLRLYATDDPQAVLCDWRGSIKGAGNYFIIRPLYSPSFPNPGFCHIEQYQD